MRKLFVLMVSVFVFSISAWAYNSTSIQGCFQKAGQRYANVVPTSLGKVKALYN